MSSLIEVKHLKKYYNKGEIKALDDVSVNIERGDVMVVIGPSGSGKSTLLRSLNLLEVPTAGEIDFDGVDITKKKVKNEAGKWVKLDLDKHRQKMGMVFQHFNLFPHMTILDNMTLAPIHVKHMPKSEAEQKAHALLERVGLGDRAEVIATALYFCLTYPTSKVIAHFEKKMSAGSSRNAANVAHKRKVQAQEGTK